jgi:hypothetical protein
MSEREGTPEDFARMLRGEEPEPGAQETEPSPDEKQVIDWFGRSAERQEAERRFIESLHRPYEGNDAA